MQPAQNLPLIDQPFLQSCGGTNRRFLLVSPTIQTIWCVIFIFLCLEIVSIDATLFQILIVFNEQKARRRIPRAKDSPTAHAFANKKWDLDHDVSRLCRDIYTRYFKPRADPSNLYAFTNVDHLKGRKGKGREVQYDIVSA